MFYALIFYTLGYVLFLCNLFQIQSVDHYFENINFFLFLLNYSIFHYLQLLQHFLIYHSFLTPIIFQFCFLFHQLIFALKNHQFHLKASFQKTLVCIRFHKDNYTLYWIYFHHLYLHHLYLQYYR